MSTTQKRMGRPRRQPNAEERAHVIRLRLAGRNVAVIATMIGCHEQTLRRMYRAEMEQATRDLLGLIAWKAYELAMAGNGDMLRFILRTRYGWMERKELTGADAAPLLAQQPPVLLVEYVAPPV